MHYKTPTNRELVLNSGQIQSIFPCSKKQIENYYSQFEATQSETQECRYKQHNSAHKVNVPSYYRGNRGIALLLFVNLGTLDGVGGQHHAPAAFTPGKIQYPLYRRLGRPRSRSG
jgi:hypothetical protein